VCIRDGVRPHVFSSCRRFFIAVFVAVVVLVVVVVVIVVVCLGLVWIFFLVATGMVWIVVWIASWSSLRCCSSSCICIVISVLLLLLCVVVVPCLEHFHGLFYFLHALARDCEMNETFLVVVVVGTFHNDIELFENATDFCVWRHGIECDESFLLVGC